MCLISSVFGVTAGADSIRNCPAVICPPPRRIPAPPCTASAASSAVTWRTDWSSCRNNSAGHTFNKHIYTLLARFTLSRVSFSLKMTCGARAALRKDLDVGPMRLEKCACCPLFVRTCRASTFKITIMHPEGQKEVNWAAVIQEQLTYQNKVNHTY